ncbi:acyltransferase family protein [Sphingomonas turrisvirgatae]|uniref:Acyltransferase 3 domain-containing protein n=1 Tax=Sphingomonas turrisvirgatae TaxID=1888892 RepID=A0A1E3M0E0_9SPHN|nr:acyltransferase [Sphingomonas turrisvirgatae]ODP39438.1 hypothetical protein BFL28_10205 [Sphingomonas turrisvirgatae]
MTIPRPDPDADAATVRAEPTGAYFHMDAMRTMFALLVAFGHAWALIIRDYRPPAGWLAEAGYYFAGFGHQAVILFFVLSGFWISRSVVRRAVRGWSWRSYLVDRLTRLMPVLLGALAVGGLLDTIAVRLLHSPTHLGLTDTYVLRIDIARHLSWEVLLANMAFLQVIVPTFGTNGPLWSLSYEFWFYIWFPALWLALRHRRLSLALVALTLGWFVPKLALAFLSWLCGAALYGVVDWLARRPPPRRRLVLAFTVTAAIALLATLADERFVENTWQDPALALVFSAFLLGLILLDPPAVAGLRPMASYGARASFSFYATHFPVMAFACALLLGSERLVPDVYGMALVALALLLSISFAWVFAAQTEGRTPALRDWLCRVGRRRLRGVAQG